MLLTRQLTDTEKGQVARELSAIVAEVNRVRTHRFEEVWPIVRWLAQTDPAVARLGRVFLAEIVSGEPSTVVDWQVALLVLEEETSPAAVRLLTEILDLAPEARKPRIREAIEQIEARRLATGK